MSKSLILSLSLNICLVAGACGHKPVIPTWSGKIYTGDSESQALVRKQDPNDVIKAASPEFNQVKCMTDSDFESFIQTYVFGCKDWGKAPLMSLDQAKEILPAGTMFPVGNVSH